MRDFHLLIDVGNTFLKWGLFQPSAAGGARENRLESGHALLEEIPALPAQFAKYPAPSRIVISNVAGTRVRAATIRVLEVWPDAPGSQQAGFSLELPADEFVEDCRYSFVLRGRRGDRTVFACPITRPSRDGPLELAPSRFEGGVLHI